jgi:hypothetical protein
MAYICIKIHNYNNSNYVYYVTKIIPFSLSKNLKCSYYNIKNKIKIELESAELVAGMMLF